MAGLVAGLRPKSRVRFGVEDWFTLIGPLGRFKDYDRERLDEAALASASCVLKLTTFW